jgi:NitT/TauT family transport system ATP-binding protein
MAANIIEVDNVSYSYNTNSLDEVLSGVSFLNREGEFFCVLGPSGCGKTTVLRLVAGFDLPTRGTIKIGGRSISGPGVDRGVVFQGDDSLFTWLTALDNITFGPRMRRIPKRERTDVGRYYIDLVGLTGHEHKYPGELSGGMRQRIQIARVLANDPKILLMDEPFGSLDAQTRSELQDELVRIWAKTMKTVIFITHDIVESLLLADRIAIMGAGPKSTIREVIEVGLPRPRSRSSVRFGAIYEQINRLIVEEVRSARATMAARS